MSAISLATEAPDYGAPMDAKPEKEYPKKTVYPSIYINDAPTELCDIPVEGTATIKYRVQSTNIRRKDDESSASVEIEILSFEPKDGKPANVKKEESVEEAFGKWDSEKDDDEDEE
jgi:hypothetical protein